MTPQHESTQEWLERLRREAEEAKVRAQLAYLIATE